MQSHPFPDCRKVVSGALRTQKSRLAWVLWIVVGAFIICAWCHSPEKAFVPTVFAALLLAFWLWEVVTTYSGHSLDSVVIVPAHRWAENHPWMVACVGATFSFILVGIWIALVVRWEPSRLVPAGGLWLIVFLVWLCSNDRKCTTWRPVLWGIGMQFFLGFLVLRTSFGFHLFKWLGNQVSIFLLHADEGSKFVFGPRYEEFPFAFKVLPVIIFFSSVVSVCFHWGLLQIVFVRVGWLMERTMGTRAGESLVAGANIFIGMTEAPLLVRPILSTLSKSEVHAIMTAGFATIAGGVMAAYISFGVPAEHLIAASVMSCPAALALAKLSYPEAKDPDWSAEGAEIDAIFASQYTNSFDAMVGGASSSVSIVAQIAANLIAFIAMIAFLNNALEWVGGLVGIEGLTFDLVASYVLWPVAFLIGVPQEDCKVVGLLLGQRIFINEFVAYTHLAELRALGQISVRAETIATYALCGFANIGAIGVTIGGLTAIAPSRQSDFAQMALRAMLTGNMACLMTACIAGMLVDFNA